jgi:XTP/dITP diphosphohydrolase
LVFESLLLATGNRGKYKEFLELLPPGAVGKLLFASDAGIELSVEETGATYAANALLKARAGALALKLPCLADDSGIEVEALGWAPGVRSARAAAGTDQDRILWLLSQMDGHEGRRARFVAAVALALPESGELANGVVFWKGRELIRGGVCWGTLGRAPQGEGGFGYDPLFIPDGYDASFGQLPPSVKNQISHRARAIRALFRALGP